MKQFCAKIKGYYEEKKSRMEVYVLTIHLFRTHLVGKNLLTNTRRYVTLRLATCSDPIV